MNGPEWVGLFAGMGLLLYLTVALLKPEWFS
jgi:K+-transporting ATPase KdpF subunit